MPQSPPIMVEDIHADLSSSSMNRYSMPVTRSKTAFYDISSLDQTNTTRFLFGEEEEHLNGEVKHYQPAPVVAPSHDESFPTLTRHEGQPHMVCFDFRLCTLTSKTIPFGDFQFALRFISNLPHLREGLVRRTGSTPSRTKPGAHLLWHDPVALVFLFCFSFLSFWSCRFIGIWVQFVTRLQIQQLLC